MTVHTKKTSDLNVSPSPKKTGAFPSEQMERIHSGTITECQNCDHCKKRSEAFRKICSARQMEEESGVIQPFRRSSVRFAALSYAS